jgi:hypothetical protein
MGTNCVIDAEGFVGEALRSKIYSCRTLDFCTCNEMHSGALTKVRCSIFSIKTLIFITDNIQVLMHYMKHSFIGVFKTLCKAESLCYKQQWIQKKKQISANHSATFSLCFKYSGVYHYIQSCLSSPWNKLNNFCKIWCKGHATGGHATRTFYSL